MYRPATIPQATKLRATLIPNNACGDILDPFRQRRCLIAPLSEVWNPGRIPQDCTAGYLISLSITLCIVVYTTFFSKKVIACPGSVRSKRSGEKPLHRLTPGPFSVPVPTVGAHARKGFCLYLSWI